jgi:hypothetical protein
MATTQTASERIIEEVSTWPGIDVGPNARGGLAFKLGRREIGHLHGDHVLHTNFPKPLWAELREQGRIVEHPVFPGRVGPAARRIEDEADILDAIALLRLNYDRMVARDGSPVETAR